LCHVTIFVQMNFQVAHKYDTRMNFEH